MATLRTSASSIFGTITSAAGSITTALDTGTKAIDMLSRYVDKAATKQQIDHTIELSTYANVAVDKYAKEEATRVVETANFKAKSELHQTAYDEAHSRILKLLQEQA